MPHQMKSEHKVKEMHILFRLINRRCLVLTDLFDDKNRD